MIGTVICPNCKGHLFIPDSDEDSDVLCSRCNGRFVATFALLYACEPSIREARTNLEHSMRIYDLRVLVRGATQPLEVSLPVKKKVLSFAFNDRLLILRTRGQRLALLQNITSEWTAPIIESAVARTATSVFIAVAVVVFGWVTGANFSSKYAPYLGAGLAAPLAFFVVKKGRQRHFIELDEKAIAQLSREQELLQKMAVLQEKLDQLGKKREQQLSFQSKSDELHSQLLTVPRTENYQAIVSRGKALAQKHEAVLQQLIEGYQQSLNRVQIALNASRLVESMPEDDLFDDMAELEALDGLERQRLEIEAQLASLETVG
jgi:hypothetical protein